MGLNREKISCYVVPEIKEYLVSESERMGMSQGAFLTMVIQAYKQQTQTISGLEHLLNKINELKNNL